ncbi:MAG: nucleotidyltransferase family protein [Candidatus Thermoplasmatota archaeon]|nr:nucleotidyltransferase family protein [Candidatus Thermoplasmatota archaeon]MCL5794340.1 nucleotidyltransferase family protein [Candidatus Thermoplasmatota archaeon]
MRTTIVLLAAGISSRFGADKLSARLGGIPLMERALNAARNAGSSDLVIVLQTGSKLARYIPETANIVYNPEPEAGISGSVRLSFNGISGRTDAILFTLADQPFVSASMLHRLIDTAEKSSAGIVSYSIGADPRNPALFKRRYFHELLSIKGDRGAKSLIKEHENDAFLIEPPRPEFLFDIDTHESMAEAENIRSMLERGSGTS